jgi:primosomal protein DnaI
MEKINQTLKRLASNENFQKRYMQMRNDVLGHPDIKAFLLEHQGEINQEIIEKSLAKLYEYTSQSKDCSQCPSLEGCVNIIKGYQPKLVLTRNSIDIQYEPCEKKILDDERRKNERLIKSLYVPKDILNATFDNLEQDSGRLDAVGKAAAFLKN